MNNVNIPSPGSLSIRRNQQDTKLYIRLHFFFSPTSSTAATAHPNNNTFETITVTLHVAHCVRTDQHTFSGEESASISPLFDLVGHHNHQTTCRHNHTKGRGTATKVGHLGRTPFEEGSTVHRNFRFVSIFDCASCEIEYPSKPGVLA